jgi:single-strand DNA-binding protein
MIKLQIVGNLGRDGVVREANGKNVINFSVAHTERFRDSAGSQKERTTWVDCSFWTERTGIAPYLKKGTLVYAEGSPGAEAFMTKDGNAGVALRLRVSNVQLLGAGTRPDGAGATTENGNVQEFANAAEVDASDDLPF